MNPGQKGKGGGVREVMGGTVVLGWGGGGVSEKMEGMQRVGSRVYIKGGTPNESKKKSIAARGSRLGRRVKQRLLKQDWGHASGSGIIQGVKSGKASERPVVDGSDLVAVQAPVKARYELAW